MKAQSLLVFALLPVALFAGGNSPGTPTGPTIIPGGTVTTTYVISAPGSYILGGNRIVSAAVNAIEITAPDVTLDLGGFSIDQTTGTKYGINIAATENVDIHDGSILHTAVGLMAGTGKGLRVTNVRVVGASNAGMIVSAAGAQIDRCRTDDCAKDGIWVGGDGPLVTDCVISGGSADAWGLNVFTGGRAVRCVVSGAKVGIAVNGTVENCSVSKCSSVGFWCFEGTLRNCESLNNPIGAVTNNGAIFITGTRITGNQTAVNGTYVNGGGNFIQ